MPMAAKSLACEASYSAASIHDHMLEAQRDTIIKFKNLIPVTPLVE
jgi:hypothetical protein